jgi:transaldolase
MEQTYFFRVQKQTATRFWINNVTRRQAQLAIDHGAVGCTQNPSYTWKMLNDSEEGDHARRLLDDILLREPDDNRALVELQRELIGGIAGIFKPLYDSSHGKQGYVSIQGDPFREGTREIIDFARFNRQAGENIVAKIPSVETGIKAVEELAGERVPINATECMALRQVLDVCEVYEKTTRNLVNPAPLFFSVITGIYDEYMANKAEDEGIDVSRDSLWVAGFAVAKKIYEIVKQRGYGCHFVSGGARGLHHFTEMVGADCAVTINWNGAAERLAEQDPPVISRFSNPVPYAVIDELTEKMPDFRKAYYKDAIRPEEYESFGPVVLFRSQFESAWKNALESVAKARAGL